MFDQEAALNWVQALHSLGFNAWIQDQEGVVHGVWVEEAGLLFRADRNLKSWLMSRWEAELQQGGVKNG